MLVCYEIAKFLNAYPLNPCVIKSRGRLFPVQTLKNLAITYRRLPQTEQPAGSKLDTASSSPVDVGAPTEALGGPASAANEHIPTCREMKCSK